MHRLSAAKACFLSESTGDVPEPEELIKLLDQVIQFGEILFYLKLLTVTGKMRDPGNEVLQNHGHITTEDDFPAV